ncbi:iron(II) transport protein A [Thermococcus kodakarensis KOD1]|uniref:Iron(II) transport protein A n=1 Tax=Thermococcus kodakarensis (strain ATCC BAA-918 / JCM 12380 / KOD1) TaxID=69014 RepID=Q5JG49_THEKO|nr:FeoA family protein [Thermococcus kodakarensis]WCN28743.1 FeoA family protein [Thermococcus kodakarensis]WCN31040.1 FeoA family protein [Thermococcus kodakarensis]BAD84904.1 iron(II) transport protein A [Thermococcus kodakarensis KOD1]
MMPLAFVEEGRRAVIRGIAGGRGVIHRLAELGLSPGTEVVVVRNQMAGPMMVTVRGTQLALGRGLAMKIQVEVIG